MQNSKIPVQKIKLIFSLIERFKMCYKIFTSKKVIIITKKNKDASQMLCLNFSQPEIYNISVDIYAKTIDVQNSVILMKLIKSN